MSRALAVKPEVLAAEMASGSRVTILDVRSRDEFVRGHVPGAIHITFQSVGRNVTTIPSRPDERLVVYCGHGPRAWLAGIVLRRRGFRRVEYLEGHMTGWVRAGLPVETGE